LCFTPLFRADDPVLSDTLAVVRVALLVMTAFALLGIQPTSPLASERPIWPFTEPSHFALAAAPFFIDGCIRGGKIAKWLWLGVMSALVLLLKSVVLGVANRHRGDMLPGSDRVRSVRYDNGGWLAVGRSDLLYRSLGPKPQ
jgi:hypothetical protein